MNKVGASYETKVVHAWQSYKNYFGSTIHNGCTLLDDRIRCLMKWDPLSNDKVPMTREMQLADKVWYQSKPMSKDINQKIMNLVKRVKSQYNKKNQGLSVSGFTIKDICLMLM